MGLFPCCVKLCTWLSLIVLMCSVNGVFVSSGMVLFVAVKGVILNWRIIGGGLGTVKFMVWFCPVTVMFFVCVSKLPVAVIVVL